MATPTRSNALLADEAIILSVGTDSPPQQTSIHYDRQGPVPGADTRGIEAADSLEMERRMVGIGLEKLERLVGQRADLLRQCFVSAPEAG